MLGLRLYEWCQQTKIKRKGTDLVEKEIPCVKSSGFTVEQCSVLWDVVLESDFGHVYPDLLNPGLADAFLRVSVSSSVTWDWQSLIRWCENVRAYSLWRLQYDVQNLVKKHSESVVNYMLLLLLSHFSRVWLCVTPEMAAHQAPLSLGFSRQEHWSGLPFPSPMHESEKWKWKVKVKSLSRVRLRPHGLQPTRLLRPWDFPGKSTGVGCHCLFLSIT